MGAVDSVGQPERAPQNRVIALFRNELGYRYLGDWTDRDGNSNIEEGILSTWLTKSGYTHAQIGVALHKLRTDLHVAIQDAMGWLDYHLHEFRVLDAEEKRIASIGIPTDEDPEDRPCVPSWQVSVSSYFGSRPYHALPALYAYDFGDDWEHLLVHEGLESAEPSLKYPRCVSGARRCPPEDCGGVHGYAEFLVTISDSTHPEHDSTLQWVGGHYDPDAFDPNAVVFENPRKRWKIAFEK